MTHIPNDDKPGFVAEEPEHCHACYRFIRSGEAYFLTIEQAVVRTNQREKAVKS